MKVKQDSWHFFLYRLYVFLKRPDDWVTYSERKERYLPDIDKMKSRLEQPRDFCQYTRSIFVWLPLRILWAMIQWSPVLFAAILLLNVLVRPSTMLAALNVLGMLALFAAFLAVIVGVLWVVDKILGRSTDIAHAVQDNIVWKTIKSTKGQYCPMIEVEK